MMGCIRRAWNYICRGTEPPRHPIIEQVRARADEVESTAGREKEALDRVEWARHQGIRVVDGLRGSVCEMARRLGE